MKFWPYMSTTNKKGKLVVDHEFVDILGCLHAIVLHIGATKNEGHFMTYVVFETSGGCVMIPR